MQVITLANQKGGVAKTTTSIVLASGFTNKGKQVLAIDLKVQTILTHNVLSSQI